MADQTYVFPSPLEVQITGATDFAVSGNLTVVGTSAFTGNVTMAGTLAVTGTTTLTGLLTTNGGVTLGANQTLTTPATGSINMATGAQLKANGTQASAILDAEVAHDVNSTFDDTEVEAALDAVGTTINSILTALRGVGIIAT